MTSRQLFEYALIELNKVQAPSLLLEDYNYFINKAVSQYINKVYNLYDINQQKSDDLRVLKSTAVLNPIDANSYGSEEAPDSLFGTISEVYLPDDYLHTLNCVVEYNVKKTFKCYDKDTKVHFGAKRLTADMFSQIINNYYMRPQYRSPYYYINNVNKKSTFVTKDDQSPVQDYKYSITIKGGLTADDKLNIRLIEGTSLVIEGSDTTTLTTLSQNLNASNVKDIKLLSGSLEIPFSSIASIIADGNFQVSVLPISTRTEKVRYGNTSRVKMEIRYGKDSDTFELSKVYVDYLKAPQHIRLTQTQVDEVEDKSQVLEFPDYICQEIVNELIMLLMENASDPRLQSHIPINQSIANPAQEQPKK